MMFLKPLRLLMLLGIGIIILIHLKKKKLKEIEIPSIRLWEKVFNDINKVNKKKINKYLLLILHILIGTLIIVSFSEPYFISKNKNDIYTLAFDCSISMNAIESGESRMDLVIKKGEEFINNLPEKARFNILYMKEKTGIIKEDLNKNEAKKKLKELEASKDPLDIEKANEIIKGFGDNVVIFTDKDIFKNNKVVKVGDELKDLGIIYGSLDRNLKSGYCILKNYGNSKERANVLLRDENGNKIALNDVILEGKEEKKLFFYNLPEGIESVNFYIENKDMISQNNYYSIETFKDKKKVLFLGEGHYLERAIKILPYVELVKKDKVDFSKEEFDFYIVAKDDIKDVPEDKNVWWINPKASIKSSNLIKGEMDFNDDKFSYGLNNLQVQGQGYELVSNGHNIKNLIKINDKTLMYIENNKQIYSSVDWDNSSMVLTPAFPIFVDNLLGYYLKEEGNYKYKDFAINNTLEEIKTTNYYNSPNINLKNVLILVVLILLVVEWRVFKLEY